MSEQPQVFSMRAARQLDGATVEMARAEAARVRAEADAAAQGARLAAERERRAAEAEARRAERAERERERAERRARRTAARQAARDAVMGRRELLVTVAVIVLSVSIALPAQIGFLRTAWVWPMAVAGGIVPEALTWAFAVQGRRREERGLSARFHHTGTWASALLAAGINLTHGAAMWGPQFGIVAALGSLAAPILWDAYRRSQSTADDGRTPLEARTERARRRHHRTVARLADRIRTASVGTLDPDGAWTLAWRAVHGAEPGITADLLARHHKAAAAVGQLLAKAPDGYGATSAALDVLTRPIARTSPAVTVAAELNAAFDTARPIAALTGPYIPDDQPRTEPYIQASARTPAQPETGRTAPVQPRTSPYTPDGTEMASKRAAARQHIRRLLTAGLAPSPTDIGRHYGLSPEWGAKQIRAVRNQQTPAA
ncbi:hypothetical protein ACIQGZ_02640 [Streptomyces sp. NPDC092296]|uniref:hypothetical protein n=1 Tax=Streptomyces sp. NPDC092296 TaxID=3366012 RepID=UPI00380E2E42